MKSSALSILPPFLLAALLFAPVKTHADVLVLTDGSMIKTQGAWEVDGRRVLYSNEGGTLSAIRLSNVDLEASKSATHARNNPEPARKPAPRTKPVALVLEDGDVSKSRGRVMTLEALFASGHRLADEVWALNSAYDMATAEGVTKALPSFEALAHRWRQQATEATGAKSIQFSDGASTMEALAEMARKDPAQLARQWPKQPPS